MDRLQLIKNSDIVIATICLILLFILGHISRRKYNGMTIQKYFYPAMVLRFVFVVIYAAVIQFYYGYGDTTMYYQAVHDMHDAVSVDMSYLKDIYLKLKLEPTDRLVPYFMYDVGGTTHYYMYDINNYMVPKFALPFSLIFFRSYLAISFCISFFAFAGCWRIFKVFYDLYPHLHKKLAIAILFLPSVLFWGVGLLKDSICIGALGFVLHSMYYIFFKKKKIAWSVILLIFNGTLLYFIKTYILLSFIPAFLLWWFFLFSKNIKDPTLRRISAILLVIISIGGSFFVLQKFTSSDIASQFSTEQLLATVQKQQTIFNFAESTGSNFSLGQFDNSTFGLIMQLPKGITATLFRPFIWEIRSPFMLLSALEALGFMILTWMCFRRIGLFRTFKMIFANPVTIFCFVYSILFAGLIGITTLNFGALVRYKIPCIPFYLLTLFIIMDQSGKFSKKYIFGKRFF